MATLAASTGVLLVCAWAMLASGLLRQNHPHAARLVPGHVRRLRTLFLLSWLAVVPSVGLLLGSAFGHTGVWTLGVAALTLFIAWSTAWPQYAWLAWVAWFVVLPLTPLRYVMPTVAALRALPSSALALVLLLMLAAAWLSARCLLLQGGRWHARRHVAVERTRQAQRLTLTGEAVVPLSPLWAWVDRALNWAYYGWLSRSSSRPASAGARLALVFGPRLHWSSTLSNTLLFGTAGLLALLFVGPVPSEADAVSTEALQGVGFGLLMACAGQLAGLRVTLHASRREQALLMLAPGLPRAVALNRWLLLRLLAHYLAFCTLIVAFALLAMACLFGANAPPELLVVVACQAALGVPAGLPLLVRDWSRMGPPSPWSTALVMVAAALLGLAVVLLVRLLQVPPAAIVASGSALLVVVAPWCWRRVHALPPMLPVARRPACPT